MSLGRSGDDLVGGVEQRLGAAIVLFERDDARVGELSREVEDVADGGGAERVDCLSVVADHGEGVATGTQHRQDLGLQKVGVLILVHEHAVETAAHGLSRARLAE